MIKHLLQSYWRLSRSLTLGAQGCVLTADKVLLVKHSYRPGWHFPGGGVEKGETALSALSRELEEEARVIMTARPQIHGIFSNFRAFPGDHIVVFIVRDWQQPEPPVANREIIDHGLFPIDALPSDINPPTQRRLNEILKANPIADTW